MEKLIIGSTDKGAGKTSIIVGLAKAIGKNFGYMKPMGDRLLYRKKRLWDYDSALITNIFGLKENPEDMTIGFAHSKLRYMYDEERTRNKLLEMACNIGKDKDTVFVECGKDLLYGTSVHLDAISIAKHMGGKMLIIISGDENVIMDDIAFVKKYVDLANVDFAGVIVNKVFNLDDFKDTYLSDMTEMGVNVLGIIPYEVELTYLSVEHLAQRLLAKVIAGEEGLNRKVRNILVGAMSTNAAIRSPLFKKEDKLLITSGDRSDMILAALESNTAGIILTNNVLPPSNITSKASERNIPLLLVPFDTYQTAMQVDNIDPLLTKDDAERIELLEQLINRHVAVEEIARIQC
jgi:BioD-like phosphotransacetylase family protein